MLWLVLQAGTSILLSEIFVEELLIECLVAMFHMTVRVDNIEIGLFLGIMGSGRRTVSAGTGGKTM